MQTLWSRPTTHLPIYSPQPNWIPLAPVVGHSVWVQIQPEVSPRSWEQRDPCCLQISSWFGHSPNNLDQLQKGFKSCQGTEHKVVTGVKVCRVTTASVPKYYCDLSQIRDEGLPKMSKKDRKKDQQKDPLCNLTLKALENQNSAMLLWENHDQSTESGIGCSWETGWSTEGALQINNSQL